MPTCFPALHPLSHFTCTSWCVKVARFSPGACSMDLFSLHSLHPPTTMCRSCALFLAEMGHLPNASRSAIKSWVTVKRSLLLKQLERVESAVDSSGDSVSIVNSIAGESGTAVVGSMVDEVMMTEDAPEDDLDGDDEQVDDDDDDEHEATRQPEPEPEPATPSKGPSTPGVDSAAKSSTTTPSSARRRTLRTSASRTSILETPTDDPAHVGVHIVPLASESQSSAADGGSVPSPLADGSSPLSAVSAVASLGSRDLVRGMSSPDTPASVASTVDGDSSILSRSVSTRVETEHSRRRRRLVTGVTFKPGKERELFHGELGLSGGAEVMAKDVAAERLLDAEQTQLADIMRQNQGLLGKLKPAAVVAIAKESRMIDVPAGQNVFRQGDHGDEAYAVLKGSCVADIPVKLHHHRRQEQPESPAIDKTTQQVFGVGKHLLMLPLAEAVFLVPAVALATGAVGA